MISEFKNQATKWSGSKIKSVKDSLHHFLNLAILEIKFTNPEVAARGDQFLVRHIAEGLFQEIPLPFSSDMIPDFSQIISQVTGTSPDNIDTSALRLFGIDPEFNGLKVIMSEILSVNSHEFIITLPIPLSAQDPENFNVKKAIMDSIVVKEILKVFSIEEMVNIWYQIRAALAKPSNNNHSAYATIVNGRHITTFDGKTYSIDKSNRKEALNSDISYNCSITMPSMPFLFIVV